MLTFELTAKNALFAHLDEGARMGPNRLRRLQVINLTGFRLASAATFRRTLRPLILYAFGQACMERSRLTRTALGAIIARHCVQI